MLDSAIPWTAAHQAPLSMGFSRQEYWSGVPLPSPAVDYFTQKHQNIGTSQGQKDPLEKEMATHSIILAWEILWTEEPGGLQSMGSQKARRD